MLCPSGELAATARRSALSATREKRGGAQASTTIVSIPSQVTNRKRHICLKRQRASLAMAGKKSQPFCRESVDGEEAAAGHPCERHVLRVVGLHPAELLGNPPRFAMQSLRAAPCHGSRACDVAFSTSTRSTRALAVQPVLAA